MKIFYILLSVFFFLFSFINSFAQVEINLDSKGTDFWLTFLPNFHNDYYSPSQALRLGDSLYIFVASSEPTNGTIEYYDRSGNNYTHDFVITDPSKMYVFKVSHWNFELIGFNESGRIINSGNQCETPAQNSFHITTDKEVAVYALNQAVKTSDAFPVLPTDVLGLTYFILSYRSDGLRSNFSSSTPSQFAIVATEDSSFVTIIPKDETFRNGLSTQKILLNKGQVYLVQAKINIINYTRDLTGTQVISTKPIAVFSGHQRATIPIPNNYDNPSRDILIEQLPPVGTWGKNAIVVPFAVSQNEMRSGRSLFRVLAAEDNTEIFIDGAKVRTINKGEFFEDVLDCAKMITSNNPILVGGYKKTTDDAWNIPSRLGDPFFVLFPPIEQYMQSYRVLNVQAYELNDREKVYSEQYITIIISADYAQSFKIDGRYLNNLTFSSVPSSDFVYATIRVSDGVHFLEADTTFNVIIYGYGEANSYGYFGGSNFKKLNFFEPYITFIPSDSCFVAKGIGRKRKQTDAQLSQLFMVDSLIENSQLSSLELTKDSILFTFHLINNYKDGRYGVYIIDTLNLKSDVFEGLIPGFTLSAIGYEESSDCPNSRVTMARGKETCLGTDVINYGRFPQKIYRVYLKNAQFEKLFSSPIEISPGEKFNVELCLTIDADTSFLDTLILENECAKRNILSVLIESITDKNNPNVLSKKDTCNKFVEIVVTDSLPIDRGLQEIQILENNNCKITIYEELPLKIVLRIEKIDIYKDSYYRIIARDSANNFIEFVDTLQGLTLQILSCYDNKSYSFDKSLIGQTQCKMIQLYNNGFLPILLENVYFRKNLHFSIPPSFLPILINPKDVVELPICFNPDRIGLLIDTLEILLGCDSFTVFCIGEGIPLEFYGQSNCKTEVFGITKNSAKKFFSSDIFPNPANSLVNLPMDGLDSDYISIDVFNTYGQKVLHKFYSENAIHKVLSIDVSFLPAGVYYLIVSDGKNFFLSKKFQILSK